MPRQGAVACFAADPRVLPFGLHFGLFGVARFTDLAPGEFNRPGTNVVHGARPEMPIFAKFRWNDRAANHQERDNA